MREKRNKIKYGITIQKKKHLSRHTALYGRMPVGTAIKSMNTTKRFCLTLSLGNEMFSITKKKRKNENLELKVLLKKINESRFFVILWFKILCEKWAVVKICICCSSPDI